MNQLPIRRVLLFVLVGALLTFGLPGAVSAANAQTYCTSPYTVQRGDSLYGISQRCNVPLANLIVANPNIFNPSLIFVGQVLTIPGAGVEQPTVTITPSSGQPGTPVRLVARNFPPNTDVTVNAGPQGSSYDPIAASRTNSLGSITATVDVPSFANGGAAWVFQVNAVDQSASTTSNIFTVEAKSSCGDTYTVAYRDTLYGIARECNVSVSDLLNANPQIFNPSLIFIGQQIAIPGSDGSSGEGNLFTSAQVYMIDVGAGGQSGIKVACNDSAVPVTVHFNSTVAPLTAALNELLSMHSRLYGQTGLYNPLYRSNLTLDGISIQNGLAKIALSGTIVSGGTCDNARLEAQIKQTALRYSTINQVSILVNGVPIQDVLA